MELLSKCRKGKTLKVKGGKFGFQLSVIPSVSFNKRAAQSFTHDSLCFGAIQSVLIIKMKIASGPFLESIGHNHL